MKREKISYDLNFITGLPENSNLYTKLMRRLIHQADSFDRIRFLFVIIPQNHRLGAVVYGKWVHLSEMELKRADAHNDFMMAFRHAPHGGSAIQRKITEAWLKRTSEYHELMEIYNTVTDVERGLFMVDKDLVIRIWRKMADAAEKRGLIFKKVVFIDKNGKKHEWSRFTPA
ncbi:MAG: hypothetical protein PHG66_03990 [Candidatus Colwellbacteria bacterium]|nr:hypothetical protein [Candidatus Colwellbacteria bacterium]